MLLKEKTIQISFPGRGGEMAPGLASLKHIVVLMMCNRSFDHMLGALERMQQRVTPELMRLRRCHAEHPFADLKYRIFGHPRFLLRGRKGAGAEIAIATLVYNLKRMLTL